MLETLRGQGDLLLECCAAFVVHEVQGGAVVLEVDASDVLFRLSVAADGLRPDERIFTALGGADDGITPYVEHGDTVALAPFLGGLLVRRHYGRFRIQQAEAHRYVVGVGKPGGYGIHERILFALGLDESILYLAKDDEMGRTLQDLELKHHQRASKK